MGVGQSVWHDRAGDQAQQKKIFKVGNTSQNSVKYVNNKDLDKQKIGSISLSLLLRQHLQILEIYIETVLSEWY